jgi:glutaconate CoA-transferase subunit B
MNYSSDEMMTIAAARALSNDDVCFVGIGLPSAACNLARLTHAPRINLIYESGTLETRLMSCRFPSVMEALQTALTVSVPEIFGTGYRSSGAVGFLGGAQVDQFREFEQHGRRQLCATKGAPAIMRPEPDTRR